MRIKQIVLIVFFVISFRSLGFTANSSIVVDSGKIESVTVYGNEAKVVRTITIDNELLVEGFNNIIVKGVSGSADISSLQISSINGVSAAVEEVTHFSYQKIKAVEIDAKIKEIDSEISKINNSLQTLETKLGVFNNFNFPLSDNVSPDVLQKQLTSVSNVLSSILDNKNGLILELKQAQEDKENLVKQKESFLSANKRFELNVKLMVEQKTKKPLELVLVYNEKNAGWDIEYDVRILPEAEEIEIISKANIWQSTCENWEDIELLIASSIKDSFWLGSVSDKGNVLNSGVSQEYTINSAAYPAKLFYRIDFASDKRVFLVAKFLNTGDMPYIEGHADIFYGGTYKGYISFPETNVQDSSLVNIEKTPGILISKRLVKEDFIEEGILKVENKLIKEYEIFFKSIVSDLQYNELEISDLVSDKVGTGQNVSIVDVSPLPQSVNKLEGQIIWKADLSKEAKVIKYKTIKVLKDNK